MSDKETQAAVQDHEAEVWHYRFNPGPDAPLGVCGTPFMGDVEPGRIYEVTNRQTVSILEEHPEWESVSQRSYDAQVKADHAKESADEE